jgi:hypothetical protein
MRPTRPCFVPAAFALALGVALAPFVATGCGTSATGISTCKQIEEARCYQAPKCPSIQLTPPYYTNGSAVDACIRFYDTACLHGLEVGGAGSAAVTACVNAINGAMNNVDGGDAGTSGGCALIEEPQNFPACAWLNPTPAPDASDAEAGDATEAGDVVEAGDTSSPDSADE